MAKRRPSRPLTPEEEEARAKRKEEARKRAIANLKPFKPGKSGNPSGRPKGSISLVTILRKKLLEGDGRRAADIVERMLCEAEAGEFKHLKEVLDRIDGPIAVRVRVDGELRGLIETARDVCCPDCYERLLVALASRAGSQGASED